MTINGLFRVGSSISDCLAWLVHVTLRLEDELVTKQSLMLSEAL
jgi:hypothetical protein